MISRLLLGSILRPGSETADGAVRAEAIYAYLVRHEDGPILFATEYTLPSLVDFAGVQYQELDGEAEIRPGVWILPTPGHVAGHQSLAVRLPDGTVVLAGQAHDFASDFSHAVMARSARRDGAAGPLPDYHPWVDRILEFDPRRVLFAHDAAVWEPA